MGSSILLLAGGRKMRKIWFITGKLSSVVVVDPRMVLLLLPSHL